MENLLSFIPEHLLILIAATYVVGIFLKKANNFKDNKITVALMIFSITFSILLTLINTEYKRIFDAIVNASLQGILCWGVAIGLNQTGKQLKKEE
ncbi:MAG: phage holin family protein [Clostridium sp.]|uniref:phage holin family protein n=1 Tax=Clostridium sp. TaxID=1506 RepID=UPI003216D042|nr:phage holin family protein [Clostridium sp.]